MRWRVDGIDAHSMAVASHRIGDYIHAHARADQDFECCGAELVVGELLANVHEHTHGPADVTVNWIAGQLVIEVHDTGGTRPTDLVVEGRGMEIVGGLAQEFRFGPEVGGGSCAKVVLAIPYLDS